ncbi:MAG TPA: helix-turn-helix domain-containing protein [Deltaproteobacteria bacterium]|mgnify:CR=1 FL=1|nr:helix-turn-helix domain-containing protein [Deltaproteobacteria bacterium]HOM28140.1 helix-turn-helix domain-containing protein [Deltaproteobacteria bacterium]HPP79280.1 helix-turn-helix domain-containing protein [Deltaproteobacteria bacterium]
MSAKTLKDLRKAKGLTMGRLAELSGVSAKTISQYEKNPPARPSRKALSKISEALGVSTDELTACIYPSKAAGKKAEQEPYAGDVLTLEDAHVSRLVRLIDKELEELRFILMDTAELADDHPSIARYLAMVGEDIDLLLDIRARFA